MRDQMRPALGCTDPVGIAFAAATAKKHLGGVVEKIALTVSISLLKNALLARIPGPGENGIALAAAMGAVAGNADAGLEVLQGINSGQIEQARRLVASGKVMVCTRMSCQDLLIEAELTTDKGTARVTIEDDYLNLTSIVVNGRLVYQGSRLKKECSSLGLSVTDLKDIAAGIPLDKLDFIIEGLEMNKKLAKVGLQETYGMGVGPGLKRLSERGYLAEDLLLKVRMNTAAAIDARMGGAMSPAMSTAGSGNQGICATLPVAIVAEYFHLPEEKTFRALVYANLLTIYIKDQLGRLGGACGAAVCAGLGVAAAVTWMLGGNDDQIAAALGNMSGNLSGMVCDGAKPGCALKASTSTSEAVYAALLALNGTQVEASNGIAGKTVEETIANIVSVCGQGMMQTNISICEIMQKKAGYCSN